MDAARPDDDEQPVVVAVEHRMDLGAPLEDRAELLFGQRQIVEEPAGRDERLDALDPLVADRVGGGARGRQSHRSLPSAAAARTCSA